MSYVIFGSSNVYRNFNKALTQGVASRYDRTYTVINCTHEAVFTTELPSHSGASILVSSVLANFLCDAGAAADQSDIMDSLNKVITDHIEALSELAIANPALRVVVVPPLPRFEPEWYGTYLPGLVSLLISSVLGLSSSQIKCLSPFLAPRSHFESDMVHLNAAAGFEFIKYIFAGVDQAFPVLDCTASSPPISSLPPSSSSTSHADLKDLASAVVKLTSVTEKFQADVLTRREQDNLVFARLKEDRDFELNKARENRFTVSGLKLRGDQVPPRDPALRNIFFCELLQKLVDEACPDLNPKPVVKDVYVNMRRGIGAPFFEGRMDSASSSSAFRTAGAKLAKAESPNFKGLFIANAVTLTTRVRIEILRALATVLSSDTQDAFVKGFSSRPVICVKTKNMNEMVIDDDLVPSTVSPSDPGRNFTFCEAIERWGNLLDQNSLTKAYRKARPAFVGCLEQYFVVLREFQSSESADIFDRLTGANSLPVGSGAGRGMMRGQVRGTGSRGTRPYRSRGNRSGLLASKRPLPENDGIDSPSKFRK